MPFEPNFEPAVLFVADAPNFDVDPTGMIQRIAAVDALFRDLPRLYLMISFKRMFRHRIERRGNVCVETVNYFLHQRIIADRLRRAPWVYVHTCLHAVKLFPHLKSVRSKLIFDLHGVVPEEFAFLGYRTRAMACAFIERQAVHYSRRLVVVTRKLGGHIAAKYPQYAPADRILVLPNSNFRGRQRVTRRDPSGSLRLIYAGGVSGWQKVDLMLDVLARLARRRPEVQTDIFVPSLYLPELRAKVTQLGLDGRVRVDTRTPEDIVKEYPKADAGFVLRDDILLNRVSMPTKLVEYINYGLAPIVLSPEIGDFPEYGYHYLTVEDLFDPAATGSGRLEEIRRKNLDCLDRIYQDTARNAEILRHLIAGNRAVVGPRTEALSSRV
jgi:glycosyltransferase involved in cell wall biosynthesis